MYLDLIPLRYQNGLWYWPIGLPHECGYKFYKHLLNYSTVFNYFVLIYIYILKKYWQILLKYTYLLSLTTVKFSLNLLLNTTTKTKTIIIIYLPIDIFHRLLYWKLLLGRLGFLRHITQSLPDPWRTPRWVLSPSSMWRRGLMSVLLSMTLYSFWSRNVRGSGDGKRSFYDWHLLKPGKK